MKKIVLSLLMVVVVLTGTFAEKATWIMDKSHPLGYSGTESAWTPVYLNLTSTFQAEIGFTKDSVADRDLQYSLSLASDFSCIDTGTGIVLNYNKGTGIASNNSVYATWLIQSGQNIDVFLVSDDLLRNSNNDGITWKVTNADLPAVTYIDCTNGNGTGLTSSSVTTPPNSGAYVYQHRPMAGGQTFRNYGSVRLNIETENIWDNPSGYYSTDLFLVICAK